MQLNFLSVTPHSQHFAGFDRRTETNMKRRSFVKGLLASLILALSAAAWAQQSYPVRPVRIIVALPAGGSVDQVARLVAQKLTEGLGQTFLVDNRPGASGIIGMEITAKAAPDGYTLIMSPASHLYPSTFAKLPYDPVRDFAPVINVVNVARVLVVHLSANYRTVRELIAYAKANPGKLSYGTGGDGSPHHLSGVMFGSATDTKMVQVPYKGGAPAMTDLVGGRVDLMFAAVPEALPHLKGGRIRALGVMSAKRTPVLPDVPTLQEAGHSDLVLDTWIGLVAPAGTPRNIITRINGVVQKAISGDLRERFAGVGLDGTGGTPEQFAATIRNDMALYAKLVKESGMTPQ